MVMLLGFFVGPIYIGLLTWGYIERKKIILNPIAKWMFVASLPLAMLTAASLMILGGDATNSSTPRGDVIGYIGNMFLGAGIVALLVIIIQNIAAFVRNRRKR